MSKQKRNNRILMFAPIDTAGGHTINRTAQMAGPHDTSIMPGSLVGFINGSIAPYPTSGLVRPAFIALPGSGPVFNTNPAWNTPYVYRDEMEPPTVEFFLATAGMHISALIGAGVSVNVGDLLSSDGNGSLALESDHTQAFAIALESASASAEPQQVAMEVI